MSLEYDIEYSTGMIGVKHTSEHCNAFINILSRMWVVKNIYYLA